MGKLLLGLICTVGSSNCIVSCCQQWSFKCCQGVDGCTIGSQSVQIGWEITSSYRCVRKPHRCYHNSCVSALCQCEHRRRCKFEISEPLRVFISTQNKETPLHRAVIASNIPICELLLGRADVDVNLPDKFGKVPLCHALLAQNNALVNLILQTGKANVNITDQVRLILLIDLCFVLIVCSGFEIVVTFCSGVGFRFPGSIVVEPWCQCQHQGQVPLYSPPHSRRQRLCQHCQSAAVCWCPCQCSGPRRHDPPTQGQWSVSRGCGQVAN